MEFDKNKPSGLKVPKQMGISNKILILVLVIFILFTIGISIVIGATSFKNLTTITLNQLERISKICSARLTEMEKNAVRIVKNFEGNQRTLDQVKRIAHMGPYYSTDPSLFGQQIEDAEKNYFFQAQMNLIPVFQSLQHLNQLNSISFYLSSPFDQIKDAKPVLAIRLDGDHIYLGSFNIKGGAVDRTYLSIKQNIFKPIPADYFDISSVYSLSPTTFYQENGFQPINRSLENELLNGIDSYPAEPVSRIEIKEGVPIILTWYSVVADLPEPKTYLEKPAMNGVIVVEQRLNTEKMNALKKELGVDVGIANGTKLLTGTLWSKNKHPVITEANTVKLNNKSYYYVQEKMQFSNQEHPGFQTVVFSPVSILTDLIQDLFLIIIFSALIVIFLDGTGYLLCFSKISNQTPGGFNGGGRILSGGKLNHNVTVHSDDELGQLAKSFNRMAEKLLTITEDLKSTVKKLDKAQSYVKNIINSMPSVLIGVDALLHVTHWNRQAEDETGINAEDAIHQHLGRVFPRLDSEVDKIKRAMEQQQTLVDTKVIHVIDGETHYEDITIYPLITKNVEGVVIRIDDVTEHVQLEEIMIQSEKMLSVGGLAAGMAHEINNPLAGMMQNASALINRLTKDLPENDRIAEECGTEMNKIRDFLDKRHIFRQLKMIQESGLRAAKIVDNMLSFARKSESRASLHDIHDLIDKTIELASNDYNLKKKYDFRQIKISREYNRDLPKISCEAGKMQQVFLNLFKNGAEAMSERQDDAIASEFKLRTLPEGDMVRIEVENTGPAMDETTRKRVFEPFFTTKGVGDGTGLGLSISYFIITENHGGTMSVESAINTGTTFIIRLPFNGKLV